jgi:DNA-3-methyladenine glycosylase I
VEYHDKEWGRPVNDDNKHFEMLTLEGAQAGLSWETVLNKRRRYREVFMDFDPSKVARFTDKKVAEILLDPGIVRNKLKVNSTVTNAKAFLDIQKEFGSFDAYIWGFFKKGTMYREKKPSAYYESRIEVSEKISKDLKKRSFKFVGATIVYSYMQAAGMVQDHGEECYLHLKKFRKKS